MSTYDVEMIQDSAPVDLNSFSRSTSDRIVHHKIQDMIPKRSFFSESFFEKEPGLVEGMILILKICNH
jgi:hypothetical protein